MFELVADIEQYPDFLPHCAGLRVVSRKGDANKGEVTADMLVAFKVFREKFRSRVSVDKPAGHIGVEYADGPFKTLLTNWRFVDKPEGGSVVHFEIDFEFSNLLFQTTAQLIFDKAFAKMCDAFVDRAYDVYPSPEEASSAD